MPELRKLDERKMTIDLIEDNINSHISRSVSMNESLATQKGVNLDFNSDLNDLYGIFDPDKLEKIIINLVSNAVKFFRKGDSIKIELGRHVTDHDTFVLQIEDNGICFPPDQLEFIFSENRDMMEISNAGTDNEIYYKVSNDKRRDENCKTVMIVDDNKDLRDYLTYLLSEDYKTISACNGKEGLKMAKMKHPDLIISDIMMPVMDGLEMCSNLKTDLRTSYIPIILLTAKSGEENIVMGLEAGADDYLVKPFGNKELLARVKNTLEQRRKLKIKFSQTSEGIKPKTVNTSIRDREFLEKAIQLVESNLTDPAFGPNKLVEMIGMSRSLVHIKLKNLTGHSASNFITSIRLRAAAKMLDEGRYNISETVYAVGFNDHTYFTRLFKKNYGRTPTEYIKEISSV